MPRHVPEVVVACQHRQIMPNAELSEEGIDCASLHARAAAAVSEFGGVNVIVAIRRQ